MIRTTLLMLLFSTHLIAQDSLLTATLEKHSFPFSLQNGTISGEGAELLISEGASSQFFLIGEDHGFAELPQLTAAIYKSLSKHGYNHYVSESSLGSLPDLERLIASNDYKKAFTDYYQNHEYAIAFYSAIEETEMLREIYDISGGKKNTIWAVDQEFVLSLRPHLKRLSEMATTKNSKKLAEQLYKESLENFAEAIEKKSQSTIGLFGFQEEKFDELRTAFEGNSEALELIELMWDSREIYLDNGRDNYKSNVDRILMMKRNFMDFYNNAIANGEETPKALFKMGATHTYRGRSMLNIYDIGNLASELAEANGSKSTHLLVLPGKGTVNRYMIINGKDAMRTPYDGSQSLGRYGIGPIYGAMDDQEMRLVDLRPVKKLVYQRKIKDLDDALENVIYSYDFILLMPQVSGSTSYLNE